ncbi:MAG: Cna B-type domain-containing protein, partial [Synergistaceae bacterium]|nr:Cna B-type domain-containing protein [Synergistaceae bacterium]
TFTVEEVDGDGEPITVENFDKSEEGLKVTNTYKIPLGDLRAKKTWVNGKVVRENIWLKVYRVLGQLEEEVDTDLKEVEILDGQDSYEVEWKDLELTNSQGEYYDFVVREVDQNGENLDLESFEKFEDGREVINTYVIPKTDISAFKIWQDGPNTRPDIWFKLYRSLDLEDEGSWEALEGVDPVKLESGTKEVVFAGVEKTDKDGNPYYFKVVEVDGEGKDYTPDNYEKTEEGLRVTNKYIIPKGEIKALKTWFGEADKRPTIWFKLFRQIEGGQVEDVEADILELLDGVTEVAWQDMDLTDIDGNDYIYSVKEVDEDGDDYVPVYYVKEEKLLEVSNSLIEKGQLSLTKILEGRKLKDKEFTFNLMSEDMIVETVKNDGEGKISFEVLSFEEPGVYNYSIVEVKGKDSEISYDESVIKVSIKVDEKGQVEIVYSDEKGKVLEKPSFVNKYTPSKLPATGAAPMAGMLFGGLALLGGAFVLLRKKD